MEAVAAAAAATTTDYYDDDEHETTTQLQLTRTKLCMQLRKSPPLRRLMAVSSTMLFESVFESVTSQVTCSDSTLSTMLVDTCARRGAGGGHGWDEGWVVPRAAVRRGPRMRRGALPDAAARRRCGRAYHLSLAEELERVHRAAPVRDHRLGSDALLDLEARGLAREGQRGDAATPEWAFDACLERRGAVEARLGRGERGAPLRVLGHVGVDLRLGVPCR